MIDPIHSLAFSMHANPGVYALLLGSGISRAAKIPTGWEITLDLARNLARLAGETCEPDPVRWYREKFGQEPDYSILLDQLAKTPAERQQILRRYIEPTEEERSEGVKLPTAAHRAIANLTAKGYVRVIITTNFDRLIETALIDAGVTPKVLSSPDQVSGARPIIHTSCCVLKLHGDYLDTRIRNTTAELETYPPEFEKILAQILDEFGLIVCGWSAEWDIALRKAINQTTSRRFTHFWAIRRDPGDQAQRLIQHRDAQVIRIEDANSFFSELDRLIEALEQFSRPHPLSTEAAVASLKRYLASPQYRINLDDLVAAEVDRVLEVISGPGFEVQNGPEPNAITVTARVRAYEAACETLIAMGVVAGYWLEDWNTAAWQKALARLAVPTSENGRLVWISLQRYPATLLLYALGLGAIAAEERRLVFLSRLFGTHVPQEHRDDKTAVELLPPFCLLKAGGGRVMASFLEGRERRYAPLNDWLYNLMRRHLQRFVASDAHYSLIFDKLEVLIALSYAYHAARDRYWVPAGAYGYRHANRKRILSEIRASLDKQGDASPYVKSGIFGHSSAECSEALDAFGEWAQKLG